MSFAITPIQGMKGLAVYISGLNAQLLTCSIADFLCASRKVPQPLWALAYNRAFLKNIIFLDHTCFCLPWVQWAGVSVSNSEEGIRLLCLESLGLLSSNVLLEFE